MNTASSFRTHVAAALMLLAPIGATLVAQPAAAQHRIAVAQPEIRGMALDSDAGLRPGATLRLQVRATPGARSSSVVLGSSGVRVALRERSAGNYVGTYVVRRSDRIDPTQRMTARIGFGERKLAQSFRFPPSFQALAMGAPAAFAPPQVRSFAIENAGRFEPGRVLRLRVVGTPHAVASVTIPDTVRGLRLHETRPGEYVGTYTIRRTDDRSAFHRAVATLRSGERQVSAAHA
jgi:hypothetical protein